MSEIRRIPKGELEFHKRETEVGSGKEISEQEQEPGLNEPEVSPKSAILMEYRPQSVSSRQSGAFFKSREGLKNVQTSKTRWFGKRKKR